jgi:hypothetical protein
MRWGALRFSLGPGVDDDGICHRIVPALLFLIEERGDEACIAWCSVNLV